VFFETSEYTKYSLVYFQPSYKQPLDMIKAKSPIPKRLKEARKKAGLSQKALGIAAGIDEFSASPRMNQYEKGTHVPPFATLEKIAEILNVPIPYFYTEEDDLAAFLLKINSLPDEERQRLLEFGVRLH